MRVFGGAAVRVTAVITVRKYEPAYEEPATGRVRSRCDGPALPAPAAAVKEL